MRKERVLMAERRLSLTDKILEPLDSLPQHQADRVLDDN